MLVALPTASPDCTGRRGHAHGAVARRGAPPAAVWSLGARRSSTATTRQLGAPARPRGPGLISGRRHASISCTLRPPPVHHHRRLFTGAAIYSLIALPSQPRVQFPRCLSVALAHVARLAAAAFRCSPPWQADMLFIDAAATAARGSRSTSPPGLLGTRGPARFCRMSSTTLLAAHR